MLISSLHLSLTRDQQTHLFWTRIKILLILSTLKPLSKPWTARESQEVKNWDHGGACVQNIGEGKSLIHVFVCPVFEALFMKMKLL